MKWPTFATGIFAAGLLMSASAIADGISETEQVMLDWIDANTPAAIDLLEETVNISSGTMNPEGIREVGAVMTREFEALGFETEWIDMPEEMQRAGHLFARKDTGNAPKILMIGHLDTVFEADDPFQTYVRDGNIARGPGVADMKSGNVIILYALKALQQVGALDDIPVTVAYIGDEEHAGSPLSLSKRDLVEAGKWADISLGFEGGIHFDSLDWVTISRRSSSNWSLEVEGVQAHSSRIFSDGIGYGAIFEASRILNGFVDNIAGEEFVTFNAGTIQGGTDVGYITEQHRGTTFGKTNVVPKKVVVHGDLRTISQEQLEDVRARMRAIVEEGLPGTTAKIHFEDRYPPMAPTEGNNRLAAILSRANEDLGNGPMPLLDPMRRGAADVSFAAPYSDALAGLGAIGHGSHSPQERVELDTIPVAIKRAALLIYRIVNE